MLEHGETSVVVLKRNRRTCALVVAILSLHAAMLAWGGLRHSITLDEVAHLPAGMSHWTFGRFDLFCVNPPLVRMAAAVPVLFSGAEIDWGRYDLRPWTRSEFAVGIRFVELNGEASFWYYTLGRWACIPFSLLGGWVCFRWARELYGDAAGLTALVLWCFCPNVLGHAQLVTPDAGAAALGISAAYLFWRWLKTPTWGGAFLSGAALGAAQLTKFTWLPLFLLWPLEWFVWRVADRRQAERRRWLGECPQVALILVLALYVINVGYGFEGSLRRLDRYEFVSRALTPDRGDLGRSTTGNRFAGTWLGTLPVPLPKNYVTGIDVCKRDFEHGLWSYLRGQWKHGGWWYYYLYALAIKAPLGTWLLAILAIVVATRCKGYARSWRDEMVLLAPLLAVLTLVSSQTGFNHHLRYVLLIFPFAFVWMSKTARAWELGHTRTAILVVVALVWSATSSLWIYPHSLSYFNELVGGPTRGYYHLDYSNIDWGQDLLYLKRWLDEHPEAEPLGFAYSVGRFVDPRIAGIDFTSPPAGPEYEGRDAPKTPEKLGPQPGWYAVSVNRLIDSQRQYAYFQAFEPAARVGYSILVYHITPAEANRARSLLGLPPLK